MDGMMEAFMIQASFMRNAFAKIIDTVIVVMNTTTQDKNMWLHIFSPKRRVMIQQTNVCMNEVNPHDWSDDSPQM